GAGEAPPIQWCDRRLLARINRRMLDGLRREIEPASVADALRFLLAWQHLAPGTQLEGRAGLLQVIGQLQGFEAAAGAWERELLPARVAPSAPSRAAPIALVRRRDLAWLLQSRDGLDDAQLSAPARDVLAYLRAAGASFMDDIVHGARRLRAEVEDALWELVGAGRVTGDGFGGLRALVSATGSRGTARSRWHARWVRRSGAAGLGAGRWAVLSPPSTPPGDDELLESQ